MSSTMAGLAALYELMCLGPTTGRGGYLRIGGKRRCGKSSGACSANELSSPLSFQEMLMPLGSLSAIKCVLNYARLGMVLCN